jgi:hypothetical protein
MLAQRDSLDKEEWQRVREEFRNEKNDESVDESFMQIANGPNAGWKHGAWWNEEKNSAVCKTINIKP